MLCFPVAEAQGCHAWLSTAAQLSTGTQVQPDTAPVPLIPSLALRERALLCPVLSPCQHLCLRLRAAHTTRNLAA